ncbi:MAG: winged helix-turn-helix transcriptional regulator [Methylocystis sp.]
MADSASWTLHALCKVAYKRRATYIAEACFEEETRLVVREPFPEAPPRVEYEIADLGKSLLPPTQGLVDWAKANWGQVREAQTKFDAR